ncbi:unnamed protein product [Triticum turgidum subsp. durum]|uniref:DUF4220 domain-containing protein n=1 Tax=Triticum turgidum subsp. durum TaxID=4567 RepID=A0A9R0Z475_TRITD|nr:unnamed protein product [Triticum turgidum subsp. durum]
MGGFWLEKEVVKDVSLWVTRCSVLSSFGAHLILALFASIRRREDSAVRRFPVWLAYQVTHLASKLAIGKLYLDSPSSSKQLFAFWVPFVLLHLGLADNISAYSLEDNVLSWRQGVEMVLLLFVALIGAYNQRFMSCDRALCTAFVMIFFLGSYKYVERIWALRLAGFARIRSSYKGMMTRRFSLDQDENAEDRNAELDDYDALRDAHGLFGVSLGAFADYSVKLQEKPEHDPFKTWYSYRSDVVKMVEMQLSLMYDIMYTKAAVIHTWPGYIIRLASPPLTLTALLLFFLHSKDGMGGIDITITYALLIGTFLLDVRWLLRALGSSWTYAFLQDTTRCELLKKTLCCRRGCWYGLRRFVLCLDPSRLWRQGECSHRLWSRTMGQHNLLGECTDGTPMSKIGWDDNSKTKSAGVGSLVEELCADIWPHIFHAYILRRVPEKDMGPMPPQASDRRRSFSEERRFGAEFDELVITWHIATDIFLLGRTETEQDEHCDTFQKIKALSDYMMFLVAKRPEMLPGLKLHSHYEETRVALEGIKSRCNGCTDSQKLADELGKMQHSYSGLLTNKVLRDAVIYAKLLKKLCLAEHVYQEWSTIFGDVVFEVIISRDDEMKDELERRLLILVPKFKNYARPSDGRVRVGWPLEEVLRNFVLQSWVRLLVFGSIRCSRDSHAKQLGCGGELTTILWILAEHKDIINVTKFTKD